MELSLLDDPLLDPDLLLFEVDVPLLELEDELLEPLLDPDLLLLELDDPLLLWLCPVYVEPLFEDFE